MENNSSDSLRCELCFRKNCVFLSLDRGIRSVLLERQTQTIRPTVRRQRYLQPHLRISFEFRRSLPIHDAGSSPLKDAASDSNRHRHATPRRLRKGASSVDQLRISFFFVEPPVDEGSSHTSSEPKPGRIGTAVSEVRCCC